MVSVAALALVGALAGPSPQDRGVVHTARAAYRDCLVTAAHAAVAAGHRDDVATAASAACRREEQGFMVAMIGAEMALGTKREDAAESAKLEIEEIQRIMIDAVLLEAEPTGRLSR